MEVLIAVSVTLFIAAFIILVVYFIRTLIQIRQTAMAVEALARHLDAEISKADRVTDAVGGLAAGVGNIATTILSYAAGAIGRMFGNHFTASQKKEGAAESNETVPPAR